MTWVRPTLRVRLTALYGVLFAVSVAVLLAASYFAMDEFLTSTLPAPAAHDALEGLAANYGVALVGATLFAVAAGWAVAGRALAPLRTMTRTARRVSQDRLDERIGLRGPEDELRELAETFDAMLDRLESSFEAQRRFIANASHELRSPLTVIRTEADVALADPRADVAELRAMGEHVLEATDQTDALLESLMLLARSQRGLVPAEPVDLAAAVRAAASLETPRARRAGVRLDLDLRPTPVRGDARLLERLAGNLLENAVRYNAPHGFVRVATGRRDGEAVIDVANTGAPLDAAAVARLVEPFERGRRTGDARGAGLGLSIVRSVAEAHGGRLALRPRPGGGLEAQVALPLTT